MSKINKEWHLANKMPNPPAGGPTFEQRMEWHLDHSKNCNCHPMSEKLKKEIEEYKKDK